MTSATESPTRLPATRLPVLDGPAPGCRETVVAGRTIHGG